jgi:D-alanyl-D-alanine endopeptidase (penicillin-binding protein 7)
MNKILFVLLLLSNNVFANVTAKSYLVTDTHGQVLNERDADHQRPIASITKLMTVMVVLDAHQPLDEDIKLNYKLTRTYHTKLPRSIKTLTRHELIDLAMVKSDNFAAYTLCANYPGGVDHCLYAMNTKATMLGMHQTQYTDPTGLEETNVSTARDLIKLIISASAYPEIVGSTRSSVDLKVKKRWWQFNNTNPLVRATDDVIVSKTGYIHQSGGCVVMLMNTQFGQRIVAVLGSKNTRTRFPEAMIISQSNVNVENK